MKATIIGLSTVIHSGMIHILEHHLGCREVETCRYLHDVRIIRSQMEPRLFCVDADILGNPQGAVDSLVKLQSRGILIVYGNQREVPRKISLQLISLGVRELLDVTRPVDEVRQWLAQQLPLYPLKGVKEVYVGEPVKKVSRLTPREREILKLISRGDTSKEIAYDLGLSLHTVEFYRKRVMKKTGEHSIATLTRLALRSGISFLWE